MKFILLSLVLAVFSWPVHQTVTAIVPLGGDYPKYVSAPTPTPAPAGLVVLTSTPTPIPGQEYPGDSPLLPRLLEEWIIIYTNEERLKVGLHPFDHDPAISDIARNHSQGMVDTGVFDHEIGGQGPTDRALASGYDCRRYYADGSYTFGLSENIAQHPRVQLWTGSGTWGKTNWSPSNYYRSEDGAARSIVSGWMNSPGHRANILDPDARRIGVGVAVELTEQYGWMHETIYATQNFSACE